MSAITQKGSAKTNYGKVGWGLIIYAALAYMVTGSFWGSSATNIVSVQVAAQLGLESNAQILYANTIVQIIAVVFTLIVGYLYSSKLSTRGIILVQFVLSGAAVCCLPLVKSLVAYALVFLVVYTNTYTVAQAGLAMVFSKYMPTKKGSALGWATIGASLNNIIALPVLNALTTAKSFSFACICFACYMCVLGILCFILWHDDPRKRGYQPDNGDISEEELAAFENAQKNMIPNWSTKEILTNKNFWLIAIGYGLTMLVTVGIASQLVVFEVMNGVPQAKALQIMAITAVVGMIGSILSGYVDQKLGVKKASIIMAVSYALSCFCAGYLPFSKVSNVLFIFFYCIVMGAISNLPASHAIGCFGTDFARVWRIALPIIALITSVSGLLLGKVREMTGSYQGAYAVLGWCAIVAMVLFALSDSKMTKKPGEKPVVIKISNKK